jgi:hypothetical protein
LATKKHPKNILPSFENKIKLPFDENSPAKKHWEKKNIYIYIHQS